MRVSLTLPSTLGAEPWLFIIVLIGLLVAGICILGIEGRVKISDVDHVAVVLDGAVCLLVRVLPLAMPRCSRVLLYLALGRVPVSVADFAVVDHFVWALRPRDDLLFGPSLREAGGRPTDVGFFDAVLPPVLHGLLLLELAPVVVLAQLLEVIALLGLDG